MEPKTYTHNTMTTRDVFLQYISNFYQLSFTLLYMLVEPHKWKSSSYSFIVDFRNDRILTEYKSLWKTMQIDNVIWSCVETRFLKRNLIRKKNLFNYLEDVKNINCTKNCNKSLALLFSLKVFERAKQSKFGWLE